MRLPRSSKLALLTLALAGLPLAATAKPAPKPVHSSQTGSPLLMLPP